MPPKPAQTALEPFIVRAKLIARPLPRRRGLDRRVDAPADGSGVVSEFKLVFAFLGRSFAIPELAKGIEQLVALCRRAPGAFVRALQDEPAKPVRLQTVPRRP